MIYENTDKWIVHFCHPRLTAYNHHNLPSLQAAKGWAKKVILSYSLQPINCYWNCYWHDIDTYLFNAQIGNEKFTIVLSRKLS